MVPSMVNLVQPKGSSSVATNSVNFYATFVIERSAGVQVALKEAQKVSEQAPTNAGLRLSEATGIVGNSLEVDNGAQNICNSKNGTHTPPVLSTQNLPSSQPRTDQTSRFDILARCRSTVSFSNPWISDASTVNDNEGKTLRQFFSRESIASLSSFVTLMSQVFSPRKERNSDTSTARTEPNSPKEELSSPPHLRQAVKLDTPVSQVVALSNREMELSAESMESTKRPQSESLVNLDLLASPPIPISNLSVYHSQGNHNSPQVAYSVHRSHKLSKEVRSKHYPTAERRIASASTMVQSHGSFFSNRERERYLALEEKRKSKRNNFRQRKLREVEHRLWIQRRKVFWDAGIELSRKDAMRAMSYEAYKMIDLVAGGEFNTRQQFRHIREMVARWVTKDKETAVCRLSYVRLGIKWQISFPTEKTMMDILISGRVSSRRNLRFSRLRRVRRKETVGYVNEVDLRRSNRGAPKKNHLAVQIYKTSLTDPGVKLATKEKVMSALCLLVEGSDPCWILDEKDYIRMVTRSDRGQTIPYYELASCATNFALKEDLANLKKEKAQIAENMEFGATRLVEHGYKDSINGVTGVGSSWGEYW